MILLTGHGHIGSAFAAELRAQNLLYLDADHLGVLMAIATHKPNLVINASGWVGKPNVDACESAKSEAIFANIILAKEIATFCHLNKTTLIHVSSGCIYNGTSPSPEGWSEEHAPNFDFSSEPCSFYSGTKSMAEHMVVSFGSERIYIVRPRIPFDEHANPRNYLTKLLTYPKLLNMRNSLTHLGDFVKACLELWQKKAPFGIYNMTNPGSVTTKAVCAMMGFSTFPRQPKLFEFFDSLEDFNKIVKAPRSNCVLDTRKLASTGIVMRPVKEALEDAISKYS